MKIFTIARNLSIDFHRKARLRKAISLEEKINSQENGRSFHEIISNGKTNCEAEVMNMELSEVLKKAIENLSQEQKEVFLLRHVANLPFNEIANILSVNENTVKSRMRYALLNLRKQLKGFE